MPPPGTETYAGIVENRFTTVAEEPLSTFSIDVDTASYANVRRFLNDGTFPPKDAVRIEELVNYFKYDYPQPRGDSPFSVNVETAACPWDEAHTLARIGLKGKVPPAAERPRCNLVFLLDVSGSMQDENKLPLLKKGMKMLAQELRGNGVLGIVTYCTDARVALESVPCNRKGEILGTLESLSAGGSTNGGAGIQQAYDMAMRHFIKGGINRVILATDGDFNTGLTTKDEFVNLIQQAAKSGVFLTVLGFGTGNLKDTNLEALADKGNGHYAYIDSFNEARKVLLEQAGGTLETIAKDVKIQIEFNPAKVAAYRLIGYENRVMAAKDFNDDRKDAGEIGAGHTVTALYELAPPGQPISTPGVDALKYQPNPTPPAPPVSDSNDLMTVKLRYKHPDSDTSARADIPVPATPTHAPSPDFKFAAAVAEFGMLLRNSEYEGSATFQQALELAEQGKGADPEGYRSEFLNLVKTAAALANQPIVASAAPPEPTVKTPAENPPAPVESTMVAPPPAPAAPPAPEEWVPLNLVLPKPMFMGTPRNIVSPNLEAPRSGPRPQFMVPRDVTNVALGKPVTASDPQPVIGDLVMLTDGDKEGADGSFVEFGPGVQWEQADLGAEHEIFAVVLWHSHSQARVYRDVIVQISDDPNFVKNVTTVFNNDHDNSAGLGAGADKEYIETCEGRLMDCKGVRGRYVRAYGNGNTSNDMNHMIEIEVYGRLAP
jgi:Ca-activated chloride channel family protein